MHKKFCDLIWKGAVLSKGSTNETGENSDRQENCLEFELCQSFVICQYDSFEGCETSLESTIKVVNISEYFPPLPSGF